MADAKLIALAELTSPEATGLIYFVTDPGGTPVSKKVQKKNLFQGSANAIVPSGSATGNPVTLTASGSDAEVPIQVLTKGDAVFQIGGASIDPYSDDPLDISKTRFASTGTITDTADQNSFGTRNNFTIDPSGVNLNTFHAMVSAISVPSTNSQDIGTAYAQEVVAFFKGTGGADDWYGLAVDVENASTAVIDRAYGISIDIHNLAGGAIDVAYAIKVQDLADAGTNPYYFWGDSRGVARVREDNTFDSIGQAIYALYNPLFPKYTPGATDYERIITGQWNGNVAEIGVEKGGTGTLRALRLIGASYKLAALTSDGFVKTSGGDGTLSVDTASYQTALSNSAGLRAALSDENGTGVALFDSNTSATFITPILGVAAATSINKVAITAPATSATLTILNGKTLTANHSLTLAGTDSTTHTFPATSSSVARIDAAQTFVGVQTYGAGAVGAPIINLSDATTGLYRQAANHINFATSGTDTLRVLQGEVGLVGNGLITWGNQSNTWAGSSTDVGIRRGSAGVLQVTTTSGAQWAALVVGTRDAGTTTTTNGLTIGRQSTGTPAAGLGSALLFNINSSTTADQNAAQISALWTDATHASRTADIVFKAVTGAAALAEVARITAAGKFNAVSYSVGGTLGIDATITTGDLVGKTLTVVKGIITGYA